MTITASSGSKGAAKVADAQASRNLYDPSGWNGSTVPSSQAEAQGMYAMLVAVADVAAVAKKYNGLVTPDMTIGEIQSLVSAAKQGGLSEVTNFRLKAPSLPSGKDHPLNGQTFAVASREIFDRLSTKTQRVSLARTYANDLSHRD